ncbi:hypothetical protein WJX81_005738 [Elliptochloris bilobata]|uniref:Uncharacterized protein n=1 Tax=Elliptochloris bilobata TaxID=381761 RepID=A0AAW1SI16_9CHLO
MFFFGASKKPPSEPVDMKVDASPPSFSSWVSNGPAHSGGSHCSTNNVEYGDEASSLMCVETPLLLASKGRVAKRKRDSCEFFNDDARSALLRCDETVF